MQSARAHEPKHASCSAVCFYLCAGDGTETKRTWAILVQSLQLPSAGAPQSGFFLLGKIWSPYDCLKRKHAAYLFFQVNKQLDRAVRAGLCSLCLAARAVSPGPCVAAGAAAGLRPLPGAALRGPPAPAAFLPVPFHGATTCQEYFYPASVPLLVRGIRAQCGLRARVSKGSPDRLPEARWVQAGAAGTSRGGGGIAWDTRVTPRPTSTSSPESWQSSRNSAMGSRSLLSFEHNWFIKINQQWFALLLT